MAFPTDFSDVVTDDIITASRSNAITKKLGLTTIATGATTGHFSMPTSAGVPDGDPVNGAGSMVWNNTHNALYVNEDGSAGSWANITGGSAFTEAVTITATDNTNPLLTINQVGTSNYLDIQDNGNSVFKLEQANINGAELSLSTGSDSADPPEYDVFFENGVRGAAKFRLRGTLWTNGRTDYFTVDQGKAGGSNPYGGIYFMSAGYAGPFLDFLLDQTTDQRWKLGIGANTQLTSGGFPNSGTLATASAWYLFDYTANETVYKATAGTGGAFELYRPTSIAATDSGPALTIEQSGTGNALTIKDGSNLALQIKDGGDMTIGQDAGGATTQKIIFATHASSAFYPKIYGTGQLMYFDGNGCSFDFMSSGVSLFKVQVGLVAIGRSGTGSTLEFWSDDVRTRSITGTNGRIRIKFGGWTLSNEVVAGLSTGADDVGGLFTADRGTTGANSQGAFRAERPDGNNYLWLWPDNNDDWRVLNAEPSAYTDGNTVLVSNKTVELGIPSLATDATVGFPYVAMCAGTPTGTPTAKTGLGAVVIDSTNHKMYFHDGSGWVILN